MRSFTVAVVAAAFLAGCKGDNAGNAGVTPSDDAGVLPDGSAAEGGVPGADAGGLDADASPSGDGGSSDAGAGVQSTCTATSTQVTCTDHDSKTALCTIPAQSAPPSCTADGAAYSGVDDGHLANGNGVTCAALEAPFSQDGGALGASCVSSTDCALVCCGCTKPSWIFATALCVQGQCAAPALACSWGYAKDPLVCGPAM